MTDKLGYRQKGETGAMETDKMENGQKGRRKIIELIRKAAKRERDQLKERQKIEIAESETENRSDYRLLEQKTGWQTPIRIRKITGQLIKNRKGNFR